MSVRLTLPLKRALTGPILTLTTACISVSESFSRLSQPGIETLSVSASLSLAHTVALSAGSTNSPDIVTAMRRSSSRRLGQASARTQHKRHTPVGVGSALPLPNLPRQPLELEMCSGVDNGAGLGRNSPQPRCARTSHVPQHQDPA